MPRHRICVSERDNLICIGSEMIELGFSQTRNRAFESILDKPTGYQFCRDSGAPTALFRLVLRRQAEQPIEREGGVRS